MKKFLSVLLSVMLVLSMVGCGNGQEKEPIKEEPKDAKVLLEEATEKMFLSDCSVCSGNA